MWPSSGSLVSEVLIEGKLISPAGLLKGWRPSLAQRSISMGWRGSYRSRVTVG